MEPLYEAVRLLMHQAQLESAMRQHGGIRISKVQELHGLRRKLKQFLEAIQAVTQATGVLQRPVTEIRAHDVESWANAGGAA